MAEESIFLSAGDPSGDNATAKVIESLLARKKVTIFGLGGKRLKQLGQIQLAKPEDLAVIGFWEVAKHYFFFRRLFKECQSEIKKRKPKLIVLVDYPGFNLRLAKKLNGLDIPVVYYISPQLWAWGKKRIEQVQKYIDLMIPVLPFEEDFYKDSGVNVRYVGHYLLEDIPKEFIASEIPRNGHLALLPGSRRQEIERMLPTLLETAKLIYDKHKIKSVIAGINDIYDYDFYLTKEMKSYISIEYDNARKVVNDARLVVSASGTATLEVGIIGRPMVIIYKTGSITYFIAKNLVTLTSIGLINLVLDNKAVPELIQHEATPVKISKELDKFLEDEPYYKETTQKLHKTVSLLGDGQASAKTADLLLEYLS